MIGKTRNIEREMKKIRPDEIVTSLMVDHPEAFEARLLRRYRSTRLPGSCYFQFSEKELYDCKKQFGIKSKIPKSLGEEFFITLTGSILMFVFSFVILFYLRIGLLMNLSLSLSFCSLPMWLLLLLGNFGGYYSNDLSLFSSWFNRIRALIMAFVFSLAAYLIASQIQL